MKILKVALGDGIKRLILTAIQGLSHSQSSASSSEGICGCMSKLSNCEAIWQGVGQDASTRSIV
jgi:hypothetical protein